MSLKKQQNINIFQALILINAVPRNERYCNCCNTFDNEELYHFVIVCPHLADLRKTYIKKYYYERPSVFKFLDLLQSQDKKQLRNTALYLKLAEKSRLELTNRM